MIPILSLVPIPRINHRKNRRTPFAALESFSVGPDCERFGPVSASYAQGYRFPDYRFVWASEILRVYRNVSYHPVPLGYDLHRVHRKLRPWNIQKPKEIPRAVSITSSSYAPPSVVYPAGIRTFRRFNTQTNDLSNVYEILDFV